MSDNITLIIAIVSLYATGHWIGGSVLLILLALDIIADMDDPTGLKRLIRRL